MYLQLHLVTFSSRFAMVQAVGLESATSSINFHFRIHEEGPEVHIRGESVSMQ